MYANNCMFSFIISSAGYSMALKAAKFIGLEPKDISKSDARNISITVLFVKDEAVG